MLSKLFSKQPSNYVTKKLTHYNFLTFKLCNLTTLFISSIFNIQYSFSQQYNLHNYSVDDGLAQSQVFAITEDARGYIWMGTRGGGISRFDGLQFKNYSTKDGLLNDYIYDLKTDKKGNLWIATNSGVSKFDGKKFENFRLGNDSTNIAVLEMAFDKDSILWLVASNGLYRIRNNKVSCFSCENNINFYIPSTILIDHTNTMWVGDDKGLNKVIITNNERTQGKIQTFSQPEGIKNIHVRSLTETSKGKILVGTYGGGLFIFDGIKGKSLSDLFVQKDRIIHKVMEDKNGEVWMATQDNGICRWKVNDSTLTYITKTEGLCNNHTSALFQDSWGNIWFGSSGGGVSRFSGQMFMHYNESAGVKENYVFSVIMARDSSLWMGTAAKGVIHLKNGVSSHYNLDSGFIDEKVKCIYEDRSGRIWFGTEGKGIWTKRDSSGFLQLTTRDGLSGNWIKSMAEDNFGYIWVAVAGGGLSRMYHDIRMGERIHKIVDPTIPDRVNCLFADNEKIWFGADLGKGAGIILPHGANEETDFVSIKNLKNVTIRAIRKSKGFIWMATAGKGVLRVKLIETPDKKIENIKFELKYFSTNEGLTSNNIYLLEVDNEGNLWAGSENGMMKLTLDDKGDIIKKKHYGNNEGFIGIETSQNASCRGVNGELWFGTISGLTRYNPNSVQKNNKEPKLLILQMSLFYEPLENTRFTEWLDKYGLPNRNIEFNYNENHLTFDFIGINHSNPTRVTYQYKLEGFENDYSPLSEKSDATYPNIAPGNYIFKVRACNEDGVCNENALEIPFTVLPPYWQTTGFKLLIGGSILLLIALIILFFVLRSRRKQKEFREKVILEKNLIQLEQKALRLQMNPHFIFHALNSINGLIAQKDEKTARSYLTKFSKLMRSILENSREVSITLETEVATLKNYLELEKFTRGDTFDFEINCDDEIDQSDILIPPMLLQPFVENAIIHGLNSLDRRGKITIEFKLENEKLHVTIHDNGVGREKATAIKMQVESAHKSTALKVTQERLDLLNNGEKSFWIVDLKDEKGNPAGTEVNILLGV